MTHPTTPGGPGTARERALAGRSFVLGTPPGDDGRRTVADLVTALVREGRRVLLVSEDTAALDTVLRHLEAEGLAPAALALHGPGARPRAVARDLAGALAAGPRTTPAPDTPGDTWRAVTDPAFPWRDLRADTPRPALDRAAAALAALSAATAHHRGLLPDADETALARLAALPRPQDVPLHWLTAPDFPRAIETPAHAFLTGLRALHDAEEEARAAAGDHWEELSAPPAPDPDPDADPDRLTADRADALAREHERAADALDRLLRTLTALADDLGADVPATSEDADALRALAAVATAAHRPPARWLVPGGPAGAADAAVRATADALRAASARRTAALTARAHAAAVAGPAWETLPEGPAAPAGLPGPPELDLAPFTRAGAAVYGRWLSGPAARLAEADRRIAALAGLFGRDVPADLRETEDLLALAALAGAPYRAPGHWLDPEVLPRVRAAHEEVTEAARRLAEAGEAASGTFRPEIVTLPELPEVVRRLMTARPGLGGTLSAAVRADRRIVAAFTHAGRWRGELEGGLPLALAWHAAHDRLASLLRDHAALFGRYGTRRAPDLTALAAALAHAESVHRLAPDTLADPRRRAVLAACLAEGRPRGPEPARHAAAVRDALASWRTDLRDPRFEGRAEALAELSPGGAARWLAAHLDVLAGAVRLLDAPAPDGVEAPRTVGEARAVLDAVREAHRATAALRAAAEADRRLLGPHPQEPDAGAADGDTASGGLLARAQELVARGPGPDAEEGDRTLLGRYAPDGGPGTAALAEALDAARAVERAAAGALADPERRARLADRLAAGRPVPADLLEQAGEPAADGLPPTVPFAEGALAHRARAASHDAAAALIRAVDDHLGPRRAPARTLAAARRTVAAVAGARAAREEFGRDADAHRDLLGELYRGAETDPDTVLAALDRARAVRRAHPAPLPEAAARALPDAPPAGDWPRRARELAACFAPRRAAAVRAELDRSPASAAALLDRLAGDPHGPEAWLAHARTLARLAAYGRRDRPVRRLLDESADLVRTVKPCVLTTPEAAAAHLPSGLRFDLVVLDGTVGAAAGAAAGLPERGDALVVAGPGDGAPGTVLAARRAEGRPPATG
ncbi:hypothetical protein [Streptomyces termitum]|uniref:hypothetical protein n=1 Tax=Streptomyces termitum TaxID=67368 RepID=UPI00378A0D15